MLTIDELSRIFFAIYRLLGDNVNQRHDQMTYERQAEKFYRKIAGYSPQHSGQVDATTSPSSSCSTAAATATASISTGGAITRQQFMNYCIKDPTIVDTIKMLEMSICSSAAA